MLFMAHQWNWIDMVSLEIILSCFEFSINLITNVVQYMFMISLNKFHFLRHLDNIHNIIYVFN